jgi:hypothetical protein
MSIIKSLPSTMQEIRWNYKGSEGEINNNERYVRDMRQLGYNDEWDLKGYDGMAYGLQYRLDDYGWGTHGDIYKLSKEHTDKRIDGAITHPADNDINWDSDAQRGKYFWLWLDQSSRDYTPGAIGANGWWYADEVGPTTKYKLTGTLEAVDDWEASAQLGMHVLGYRYGYLDGTRKHYVNIQESFTKNTQRTYEREFTVDKDFRHIVMNFTVWQPGGYGRNAFSHARVHNVTVERI